MNGIEAVRAIRGGQGGRHSRVPIIMFSTLTERGATATLDALSAGANDYVTKPANVGSVGQSMESVREQLIPQIKALTGRPVDHGPARAAAPVAPPRARGAAHRPRQEARRPGDRLLDRRPRGAGQGAAPAAGLPRPCRSCSSSTCRRSSPASSPSGWTASARCASSRPSTAPRCCPARCTSPPATTTWWSAAAHAARTPRLNQGPPENFCRPAVDPLFRSAVAAYDGAVLAVVLTGMGSDGRNGAGEIRAAGGTVAGPGPGHLRRLGHARRDQPGRPRRRGPAPGPHARGHHPAPRRRLRRPYRRNALTGGTR